ncbi:MAG: PAS domain S-box protein [Deltaproteobacteria bacterium]|nr:MAG: PAS domain S-box protein [Deltaproteobacteria bacterium]
MTPGIRSEYFPLLFSEPRVGSQPNAGLDLASAPGVLAVLNSARDTGRVTAMLSAPWPPEKSDRRQVFVYSPVYMDQMTDGSLAERREHMRGFVRVEVPIAEWVQTILAASALRQREIFVFDLTDEDEPLFLASSVPWSTPPNETLPAVSAQRLAQLQSGPNHAVVIELGGRQLLFYILGIMAIGALITAALIIYLMMRDRALGQMQQAEKHYRELFEAAPAMYVTTRDVGGTPIISDCNELFLKTLKYERKDVIGRSLADFHSPESRIKLLGANGYRDAMKGKIVSGERELLVSDGRTIPVLLRGDPMANDAGEIVGTRAMYVDNSEQKFAEEQMRLVVESRQKRHDHAGQHACRAAIWLSA